MPPFRLDRLLYAALTVAIGLVLWQSLVPEARREIPEARPESVDWAHQALRPLSVPNEAPSEKAVLGQRLFFDRRLSRNDTLSCASCHNFGLGGADRQPVSEGIDGRMGSINAPTVFNTSLHLAWFWDGRATSLQEQAAGPVHNPAEMDSNWEATVAKLKEDASYRETFGRLYHDGISGANIADAIAQFERTLLTPNSPFDRFLLCDKEALSPLERSGYWRFLELGCASCHQGVGIGGNMFQRFGVMADYFSGRPFRQADQGRFNVTGREEDRHVFKVPSLRNVALTAPYFHDASARTLEDAVTIMARFQLGRDISPEDLRAISAFLRSLTGEWEGKRLE